MSRVMMITWIIAEILGFTMEIVTVEKMVTMEIILMAVTRMTAVMGTMKVIMIMVDM